MTYDFTPESLALDIAEFDRKYLRPHAEEMASKFMRKYKKANKGRRMKLMAKLLRRDIDAA